MPSDIPLRGVRMEDDLYFKLRAIAEAESRSYNQEAVYILRKYVAAYEREHGPIKLPEEE